MALVHFEWDLSGFSGVESDYWEGKTPVGAEGVERIGTPLAEGVGKTQTMDVTTNETVVVAEDDPPT